MHKNSSACINDVGYTPVYCFSGKYHLNQGKSGNYFELDIEIDTSLKQPVTDMDMLLK